MFPIHSANVAFVQLNWCPSLFLKFHSSVNIWLQAKTFQIKHVIGLSDYDHPELKISEAMHEVTGRTETLLPTVLTEVSPLERFPFFFPQSSRKVHKVACQGQTCVLNGGFVLLECQQAIGQSHCRALRRTGVWVGGCGGPLKQPVCWFDLPQLQVELSTIKEWREVNGRTLLKTPLKSLELPNACSTAVQLWGCINLN